MAKKGQRPSKGGSARVWPLLAVNFFMADMQSGIGPLVGVFLLERGWASGMIGTAMAMGNIAGMLITTPVGGFIDVSRHKRAWVIMPGTAVVAASTLRGILARQLHALRSRIFRPCPEDLATTRQPFDTRLSPLSQDGQDRLLWQELWQESDSLSV